MFKLSEWLHPISAAIVGGLLLMGLVLMISGKPIPVRHINPCTANASECFSIQGLYSKPECPGQKREMIDVDGTEFFLGCYLGSPK